MGARVLLEKYFQNSQRVRVIARASLRCYKVQFSKWNLRQRRNEPVGSCRSLVSRWNLEINSRRIEVDERGDELSFSSMVSSMRFRNTEARRGSPTGFLLNPWSKVSFARPPLLQHFRSFVRACRRGANASAEYPRDFINFSHIFATAGLYTISERRTRGRLGEAFRHIDYKMYTGIVLTGREPPAFISPLDRAMFRARLPRHRLAFHIDFYQS